MFVQTVTDKDGNQRQVVSDNKDDLKTGVDAVKAQESPVQPNIDMPVKKGFDLVDPSSDTGVTDGRGAHNSPRDALDDDGKVEGNPDVPFVVAEPSSAVNLKKVDGDGETSDLTDEDQAKANDAQVVNGLNLDGSSAVAADGKVHEV